MSSTQIRAHTSRRGRVLSRPLTVWQQVWLCLQAALFAGVLPFICLGAMGEPGHPHRFPHFVFAAPSLAASHPMTAKQREASPGSSMAVHGPMDNPAHLALLNDTTPSPMPATMPQATCPLAGESVAGRATASLMTLAVVLVLLFGCIALAPWEPPHFHLRRTSTFLKSITIPVPLPPPRLLFSP